MVALGAFNQKTKLVQMSSLFESLAKVLDERYHHLIPFNIKAIEIGAKFVQSLPQSPLPLRERAGVRGKR
jgi:2-oxoglutarate ferredoxin oxidoreductase subunit gamma